MSEPMTPEREAELRLYCSLEMQDAFKEIDRLRASQATAHERYERLLDGNDRLQRENREFRARVKALEEAQRWRPIETAPKGVSILLWWTPLGENRYAEDCVIGQISAHEPGKWWNGQTGTYQEIERITHWMPLPQTPVDRHASPNQDDVAEQSMESRELMGGTK